MSRVLLTADDFRILIRGGIVKQNGVEVALQDIGYNQMEEMLANAKAAFLFKLAQRRGKTMVDTFNVLNKKI